MADFEHGLADKERLNHRFPSPFGADPAGTEHAPQEQPDSSNVERHGSGTHRFPSPFGNPNSTPQDSGPKIPAPRESDPAIPPFVFPRPDDTHPDKSLPPVVFPDMPPLVPKPPKDLPTKAPDRLPPFSIPGDSHIPQVPRNGSETERVYELRRLNNRAADHMGPDAVVRLPANFDPSKPINLVIYNHGWGSTAQSSYRDNKLSEQMKDVPPNTVLIVPEWQRNAGANSGDQGNFKTSGLFANMLQEIFDKTPSLKGKSLSDVASISIFAHSAGYGPAETEIYKNGLGNKVTSITLLDALYDGTGFDSWIRSNASDLAAGRKQFYNFFQGTANYSKQLATRMQALLPSSAILQDYSNPNSVMDANTIAKYPVIFKYSTATDGGLAPHYSMPHLYVGPVESAARMANRALNNGQLPPRTLPPFRF